MNKISQLFSILIVSSFVAVSAEAVSLNINTHDTLIQKLEGSVADIDDLQTKAKIHLRLGDLHADKARLLNLDGQTKAAYKHRKSAVRYYQAAFKRKTAATESRILLQLSHLYVLLGENSKAERIFKNIIAEQRKHSKKLVGEAHAGLGELQFRKSDFKNAKKNFKKALYFPIAKSVDVLQRLAWCEFNFGNYAVAERLATNTLSRKDISAPQKSDISKDLATFMAKSSITDRKIQRLIELSPGNAKKSNLFYLGQEADRLGNHKASVKIWTYVKKQTNLTTAENAEITLRSAQSAITANQKTSGIKLYSEFFKQFKSVNCKKDQTTCGDLNARSRNLVHNWLKKEKAEPSRFLKSALIIYSDNKPQDIEMVKWTANIARFQKDFNTAVSKYKHAAKNTSGKKQADFLSAMIETAEESNNNSLRNNAYKSYLEVQPNGPKAGEVKYQMAYIKYTQKNYTVAAKDFYNLTKDPQVSSRLKLDSAELSLDSLALINDKKSLELYSLDYAKRFKVKRIKFLTVARKAIVNSSIETYKAAKSNSSKIRKALNKLMTAPLAGATQKEQLELQQNRLKMASDIRDLKEIDKAALAVLVNKQATSTDIEMAKSKRLFVAESELRFVSALKIASSMKFSQIDKASRDLKLGLLSDLAGRNPSAHYKSYIKNVRSRRAANVIRLEMIRRAKNPWSQFKEYRFALAKTPDIYTQALVEAYGRKPSQTNLKKYAKRQLLSAPHGASALRYQMELMTFDKYRLGFRGQKLDTRSDARLTRSLKKRIQLLNEMERYAQSALNKHHLGIQIRALDLLSREYKKLYMQVLGLPVPRGLKTAQRTEYKQLLKKQALPYLQKSDKVKAQLSDLWSSNKQLKNMIAALEKVSHGEKSLLVRDLRTLKPLASKRISKKIDSAILKSKKIDHKYLVKQFKKLKNDPFDKSLIQRIKKLETKRGQTAMVTFLDAREQALKKGKI